MSRAVVDVSRWLRSPYQMISIVWEVDDASGSTQCQAWRGQYEIDRLEAAGYRIVSIQPFLDI